MDRTRFVTDTLLNVGVFLTIGVLVAVAVLLFALT